ncbi:hypothetical protein ACVW1A_001843 [Bradyrhizobium sp. LB1.3]
MRRIEPAAKSIAELSFNILPKREPLLFLIPNVLPLKEWNLQSLLRIKHGKQR